MNNLAGILGQIQELESKIQEGEESLEEILDDRNRIEKELRRNSRELAAKNEELVDLRNMKESLVQKKGKLWKEYEKEEFDRNIDSVERERGVSPKESFNVAQGSSGAQDIAVCISIQCAWRNATRGGRKSRRNNRDCINGDPGRCSSALGIQWG